MESLTFDKEILLTGKEKEKTLKSNLLKILATCWQILGENVKTTEVLELWLKYFAECMDFETHSFYNLIIWQNPNVTKYWLLLKNSL